MGTTYRYVDDTQQIGTSTSTFCDDNIISKSIYYYITHTQQKKQLQINKAKLPTHAHYLTDDETHN